MQAFEPGNSDSSARPEGAHRVTDWYTDDNPGSSIYTPVTFKQAEFRDNTRRNLVYALLTFNIILTGTAFGALLVGAAHPLHVLPVAGSSNAALCIGLRWWFPGRPSG